MIFNSRCWDGMLGVGVEYGWFGYTETCRHGKYVKIYFGSALLIKMKNVAGTYVLFNCRSIVSLDSLYIAHACCQRIHMNALLFVDLGRSETCIVLRKYPRETRGSHKEFRALAKTGH